MKERNVLSSSEEEAEQPAAETSTIREKKKTIIDRQIFFSCETSNYFSVQMLKSFIQHLNNTETFQTADPIWGRIVK